MQPLQDDFRDPAAKDNSITNAATARSNFDAAIAIGSAETELQNTIELRATASEIVAPTPEQKKLILNRKWKQPKSERSFFVTCMEKHRVSCICYLSKTHFVRDFLQNSIGNSSTSTTCNPIYSEKTILELQITMEFHRQLIHQHHLQSHLHCRNDPTVTNHNGILSTANARNTGETPFTMRNRSEHDPKFCVSACKYVFKFVQHPDNRGPQRRTIVLHMRPKNSCFQILHLFRLLGTKFFCVAPPKVLTKFQLRIFFANMGRKNAFQVTFAQGRQLLCSSMQSWKKAPKAIINMLMATNLGRPVLKNLALLIRQHIFPPTEKVPSKTKIIVCIADTCLETCFETCFSHLSQVIFTSFQYSKQTCEICIDGRT